MKLDPMMLQHVLTTLNEVYCSRRHVDCLTLTDLQKGITLTLFNGKKIKVDFKFKEI